MMSLTSFLNIAFALILILSSSLVTSHNIHHREHLQSHVEGELNLAALSDDELRFLYFQSHDSEGNNKLDGCELVQSLLHFHAGEAIIHDEEIKVFTDAELSMMVDPLLSAADMNGDGFVDYSEFIAGQTFKNY